MSSVVERLGAVADDLTGCWLQALELQAGRELARRLTPHLSDYASAGRAVWSWYRDATLAGCRRLIEKSSRPGHLTVRGALVDLQRLAGRGHVTPTTLADLWQTRSRYDGADRRYLEEQAEKQLHIHGRQGAPDGVLSLDTGVVDRDIIDLDETHSHVIDLANRIVAHRVRERSGHPEVTEDDLERLLRHVGEVASRWAGLLTFASHHQEAPELMGIRDLEIALRIFDLDEYAATHSRLQRELGPAHGRYPAFDDPRVTATYHWPKENN